MGSKIEIYDTLKLKRGSGFPESLQVGQDYAFHIAERRLYHLDPVRVFLVEEIDDMWNFVGHALIRELTIDAVLDETRGVFRVSQLFEETYARQLNRFESPKGRGLPADAER